MAHTHITLNNDGGIFVPSAPSVPVVSGNTVSFATGGSGPVMLYFSPDATSILSPKPASPFSIAPGGKASFTFSSSKPGAYSVFFGGHSSSAPSSFPAGISEELLLEVGSSTEPPPPFDDDVKGGS